MSTLSLLFLFFFLFPIFGRLVLGGRYAPKEEAVTMENQEGDIVDCVDIYKQISLTHPLLSNHVVQMKPSWMADDDSNGDPVPDMRYKACPKNTVPVPRSTKDLGQNFEAPDQHKVYVAYADNTLKYGAGADINVYDLNVTSDQSSSHHIWVQGNVGGHLSMIIAGWRVDPSLFGDSKSRMFIYWTGDSYLNGCYNTLCPGFIQVDRFYFPGIVMQPTSTYGGEQFIIRLDVLQDRATGHWWLMANRQYPVGYWPRELLPSLQDGATLLAWGGIAKAGGDGICPPLGNGHYPEAGSQAMYLRTLEYINGKNYVLSTKDVKLQPVIDKSGCYDLQLDPNSTVVYIGGPGDCGC